MQTNLVMHRFPKYIIFWAMAVEKFQVTKVFRIVSFFVFIPKKIPIFFFKIAQK